MMVVCGNEPENALEPANQRKASAVLVRAENGQCFPQVVTIAKTRTDHAQRITNDRTHPISTGKLEGINSKIRTLKRKAYGYRMKPSSYA